MSSNKRISRIEKRRNAKKKIKQRRISLLSKTILIISLLAMIGSVVYIIKYYLDIMKAGETTAEVEQLIKNAEKAKGEDAKENSGLSLTDFYKKNTDSRFIINIPLFDISNVVVQSRDNSFYINHDFYKNYSLSGWIFADYRNRLNGTDRNIIVYGHNMRDGKTMFSPFAKITNTQFLSNLTEKDRIIEIYTSEKKEKYKIFSVYQERDENTNLSLPGSEANLKLYAEGMSRKSFYNFNEDLKGTKKMLTLATCGKTNDDRIIIHAKLIEE